MLAPVVWGMTPGLIKARNVPWLPSAISGVATSESVPSKAKATLFDSNPGKAGAEGPGTLLVTPPTMAPSLPPA